jgi:HJR/Mrr/RecB family endonuclease
MDEDQYGYGREKEEKVARSLRGKGAKVNISEGSKGAADLVATFPSGTKWAVQVKATRSGTAASPSVKYQGRLKQVANKSGATAVIAKVNPKGIEYESARSGRKLTPPTSKKK